MHSTVVEVSGYIPAIIIPIATAIQLVSLLRTGRTDGVSWLSWFLFGMSNIGLYIYTEKYTSVQSIIGLLGSAVLDFAIVAVVLSGQKSPPAEHMPAAH
ncbi:MAG: hypothetical protein GY758_24620 [Fuerstiella sp.]|jgi:uncharacterized protein with PQ loop repeat|nr:hypothetical protein [Fuerstiella sp.]MCP4507449.1 hypothetical protein [Fuerstiella sp.]MDG2126374.1 hypothetical protein [Fuerstiella sp.]